MAPFKPSLPAILLKPDESYQEDYVGPHKISSSKQDDLSEAESDKKAHLELISKAIKAIDSGNFKKVVVSRELEFKTLMLPEQIFANLLSAHPDAFCYHWYHPETGHWMGASPELFLSTNDQILKTCSLAGTRAYVAGSDPKWQSKELEEQEIVTRYIADGLTDLSIVPEVSKVESVKAGNLWHLRTEIRGSMGDNSLLKVITALHPTPAVCGFPKDRAMQFIIENEPYDRSFYTGFLGEMNMSKAGSCELFVNLRCMTWKKGLASVFVGGGITGSSVVLAEWEETIQKSRTVLDSVFK